MHSYGFLPTSVAAHFDVGLGFSFFLFVSYLSPANAPLRTLQSFCARVDFLEKLAKAFLVRALPRSAVKLMENKYLTNVCLEVLRLTLLFFICKERKLQKCIICSTTGNISCAI